MHVLIKNEIVGGGFHAAPENQMFIEKRIRDSIH